MINADEALDSILGCVSLQGSITISLEHSVGKFLSEDVVSGEDVPAFDNAGMDGYALRADDAKVVPTSLKLVGEVRAGSASDVSLRQGEAMSIMTGAPVPAGADAVIQIEWTERIDTDHVKLLQPVRQGHNVRLAGADIRCGDLLLASGHRLRSRDLGVLASIGKRFLSVYTAPRVALITTGDELVEIDKSLTGGKVRNSNMYSLRALLEEIGCEVWYAGIVRDHPEDVRRGMLEGLKADVMLTSGGVSVGKYDLIPGILRELGAEIKFSKVNIKPGMPLLFAQYGSKPIFGLPGNPVSTIVTFLMFVRPALLKMMGAKRTDAGIKLRAMLDHDIEKKDGKRHFIRGILEESGEHLRVRTTGPQISNLLTSFSRANCIIILPEAVQKLTAGSMVDVELL